MPDLLESVRPLNSTRLVDNKGSVVRKAAAEALGQLVEKGDQQTITALRVLLRDDDGDVRSAANHTTRGDSARVRLVRLLDKN